MFENRYEILLLSNQATDESIKITKEIVKLVEEHYQISIDESNGASLVTHLAITFKKIKGQEKLIEMPEVCMQEAKTYPAEMEFAEKMAKYLQLHHDIEFNKSETAFLTIHLKNISQYITQKEESQSKSNSHKEEGS